MKKEIKLVIKIVVVYLIITFFYFMIYQYFSLPDKHWLIFDSWGKVRNAALSMTPIIVAVGLYLAYRRTITMETQSNFSLEQLKIAQEGLYADRYQKALDLFTTKKSNVSLKILESIAIASNFYERPIIEDLVKFIFDEREINDEVVLGFGDNHTAESEYNDIDDISLRIITIFARSELRYHDDVEFSLDLKNVRLSKLYLKSANLSNIDFTNTRLLSARLNNANFTNSVFVGTNLSSANLIGANFSGANLENAILVEANLSGAIMSEAINLEAADFTRSKYTIKSSNTKKTMFPNSFEPKDHDMILVDNEGNPIEQEN